MPTCPLCEHVQEAGDSCDVCGRVLTEPVAEAAPTDHLPDLELGRWEEPFPEDTEPIAELEMTGFAPAAAVAAESVADLERTASSPVEVDAPPMADIDTGRSQDSEARVPASVGAATCRYCRNVQAEGAFCDRCGMRLNRAAKAVARPASRPEALELQSCQRCGARVLPGNRCGGCGQLAGEAST